MGWGLGETKENFWRNWALDSVILTRGETGELNLSHLSRLCRTVKEKKG